MKAKIINPDTPQETEAHDPVIEFWLEIRSRNAGVTLKGRDQHGEVMHILAVNDAGKLYLNVSAKLNGLQTDEKGRIQLEE